MQPNACFTLQTKHHPTVRLFMHVDLCKNKGYHVKKKKKKGIWDASCLFSNKHHEPECCNQSQHASTCLFNLSKE